MAEKVKADFARKQLEKHGWTEGKGLGREETGISKAIKVNIKTDHGGVGYDVGNQYSFHWWDHVFNKTAKSIEVKESQDGVEIVNCSKKPLGPVSNKRPNKNMEKPLLYGRFVKASSQIVQCNVSDDDSDQEKDLWHGLPEEKLFHACGGRTAHKAARHGLRLNGKLRRIEEQDSMDFSCHSSISSHRSTPDETHKVRQIGQQFKEEKTEESCKSNKKRKERTKRKKINGELCLDIDRQAGGKDRRRKKRRKDMDQIEKQRLGVDDCIGEQIWLQDDGKHVKTKDCQASHLHLKRRKKKKEKRMKED